MKRLLFLTTAVLLLACAQPALCQVPPQTDTIAGQASAWARMFSGLKASNNITMVVSSFQNVYEIRNVTALEAEGQFLILRQKGKGNRDFRVIVHAPNVLMIREGEG